MAGPNNWSGLLDALMGEWDKTKQPLKERATMLPLGQYEDGSVGLAWPGIIADPIQRGYDAANTPIPPVNDDQAWADKSAAMFDVTSLAPIGGMLGAVEGAVGSAGGKLAARAAKDLPMDQASRMARAKEMGFDTENVIYRGMTRPMEGKGMRPAASGMYGPGIYGSERYGVANAHAGIEDGGNVTPMLVRGPMATMDDLEVATVQAEAEGFKRSARDKRANEILAEKGYSGVKDQDLFNVFDPTHIRSVNAAFDPAKADSANLLAANAKEGALPGLAAQTQDGTDPQTITTANILRFLRGQ